MEDFFSARGKIRNSEESFPRFIKVSLVEGRFLPKYAGLRGVLHRTLGAPPCMKTRIIIMVSGTDPPRSRERMN